ncbi:tetratricopeptide repeat protein [Wolbachia endosymbiont of Tetranychus urticae]|uniref:tetratricopeptide repeat protein n=1 Tax=Wolbachia endosymbiont of Tetranychus urticae TaxID=169184 RepID=UPI00397A12FD
MQKNQPQERQNLNDDQKNIRWVDVPGDGSCLFWSTALAYLIPVKDNDNLFAERYQKLFGAESLQHLDHVRSLIRNNDLGDNVLSGLIRDHFRNRVVNHIENNRTLFQDFIGNNEQFTSYLNSMRNPETWGGEHEIRAMSEMLGALITVHSRVVVRYGDGNVQIDLCHTGPQDQRNHYNFGLEIGLIDENAVRSLEGSLKKYRRNILLHVSLSEVNKEIERLLLSEEAEVNIENNDGKTSLDTAEQPSEGAEVNIENNDGKTSLDITKKQNKEKITKTSEEHLTKSSHQVERPSVQEEVHKKLRKFVEDFVFIYECSLSGYYKRLENKEGKSGKSVNFASKVMDIERNGIGELRVLLGAKAPFLALINALQGGMSSIGSYHNRLELKKLIDQLYIFKKDPVKVREELVKSGIEIFRSFESQFMQVTAGGSWQRAMTKLAEDAVSRVIDYYRKNTEKEFSAQSITEGVVFGKSKKYKHISTGIPHTESGHTLESKNSWNTAELFDRAGLVTIKSDGSADKYYKRKDGKSDTGKYGYRLLFQWEKEQKIKMFVMEYSEEKPPREEYRYVLKSDAGKWQGELLDELNKQDPKLFEERLLSNFKEEMRRQIEENSNELEDYIDKNFNELSSYIVRSIAEEGRKSRESFEKEYKKLDGIHSFIIATEENKQVREPIWFDVKKPVSLFTGRKEELADLHRKIHRGSKKATLISQITSISGLGGIGKTQLAREYIQEYSKDYYNIIWINAESEMSIVESFNRLAKDELKINTKDADGKEKDMKSIVKEVYKFFSNSESLFIFDDAEKSNDLNKFLPIHSLPGGNGPCILITSRNREWERGIEVIDLNELKPGEAIEFVKKGFNIEEDESQNEKIKALVEKLQYFPLAIQQAVAYIEDQRITREFDIDDYLNEYKKKTKDLLDSKVFEGIDNDYAKTTFTTWKITIDKIAGDKVHGELALRILNIISYLSSEKISREVFLSLTGGSEEKLRSAVRLLIKYSIVNGEQNQSVLSTHKLVQEFTRIVLEEEGKSEEVMKKTLELFRASFPYLSNRLEDHLKKRQLLPHLEEFLSHIDNWLERNPENKAKIENGYLKNLLMWMSYGYYSLFNSERHRELLERTLILLEEHYREDNFEIAKILLILGLNNGDLGDYEEAQDLLERALPIFESHYRGDDLRLGIIREELAKVYLILGDYEEAKDLLERALPILESHYGKNTPKVAKTLDTLGVAYRTLGDYQRARELAERALSILENHFEKNNLEVAIVLENLATANRDLYNTQRARELMYRAHEIYQRGRVEECLRSTSLGRNKREAKIGECEFSWEDVDEFNEETDEKRDLSKIRIDSQKFIDYIKDLPERKQSQLVQLAGQIKVTGKSQGLVNKLISNQKFINHLSKVGMISGITMKGMMAKNVLADVVNGNYQGLAINLGFIALPFGVKAGENAALEVLHVASKAAYAKGFKLAPLVESSLAQSFKLSSSFLARSTSVFIAYDLYNEVQEYKKGNKDALVGVVGDSVYLGVDAAELGIEVAEGFGVLEGVSSVTGPIGATIGAIIFVGIDIYQAVKRVENIDRLIHLTEQERFTEGIRAFIGMRPESYIEELIEETQLYNQLVTQALEYLERHSDIQRYVFPTGKKAIIGCEVHYIKLPRIPAVSYGDYKIREEICKTVFQEDLDNTIILSDQDKYNNFCSLNNSVLNSNGILCSPAKSLLPVEDDMFIRNFYPNKETRFIKYISRHDQNYTSKIASIQKYNQSECGSYLTSTPNVMSMVINTFTLFELKKGYEYMDKKPSYLCHNAIGVEYKHNRKENCTLIQLGDGNDIAIGFRESRNIFISKNGNKAITGGDKDDVFIFMGNYNTGSINGMDGENTLDLSQFALQENIIWLNVNNIQSGNISIAIRNINNILGRKGKADYIHCTCDMSYVNGQGGQDIMIIKDNGCFYRLDIVVKESNIVLNEGKGNFHYFIASSTRRGRSVISLPLHSESNNTISLNYTLSDIDRIDVQSTNHTKFSISLFDVTIRNTKNPTKYLLSDKSILEIYNENSIYVFHKVSKALEEVVAHYSDIASKLGGHIFIQSQLNNETALIGHGNHDVLYSDPYHKSHLVGNGGENIFVVTSDKLPIPEIVLYDLDQENKIDTLDLRQVRKQVESDLNVKLKARIITSDKDLIIWLFYEKDHEVSKGTIVEGTVVQVRLKNGLLTNWYERLHVIMNHVPMKIEEFKLRPLPLVFDNNEEIIRIAAEDVDKNNKIIISQKIEDYTFSKLENDLIMTFNNNASLILSEFYKNKEMETLTIRFANKEVTIKDELNNVRSFDDLKEEYRNNTANIINSFNNSTEATEASNSTETSVKSFIRNRRNIESNVKSAANRPTSFINTIASTFTNAVIGTLQGITQFISARTSASGYSTQCHIDDKPSNYKSSFNGYKPESSISQVNVQTDINSTILLLDLLIRRVTGQKYNSTAEQSISPPEARDYALSITDSFEKVLAKSSGCEISKLDFDWFNKLFRSIEGSMISGQYSKVPRILHESAKNICSNPSEKFFSDVERNIKRMLNDMVKENSLNVEKRSTINNNTPLSSLSKIDIEPVRRRRAIG